MNKSPLSAAAAAQPHIKSPEAAVALARHFITQDDLPEFSGLKDERRQPAQYAAFATITMPEWRIVPRRRALAGHHQHGAATGCGGTQQKITQAAVGLILA